MKTSTIGLIIVWFCFFVACWNNIPDSNASNYYPPRDERVYSYSSGYYPPRIQQLCYNNFIGTDWAKSMKYNNRCRKLWTLWSDEMKNNKSANY